MKESEKFSRPVGGPGTAIKVAKFLQALPGLAALAVTSEKGGTSRGPRQLVGVPDPVAVLTTMFDGRRALRHRITIEATFGEMQIQSIDVVVSRLWTGVVIVGQDRMSVVGVRHELRRVLGFTERAATVGRVMLSVIIAGLAVIGFIITALHA